MTLSEKLAEITDEELIEEADRLWAEAERLREEAKDVAWWNPKYSSLIRESWDLRREALLVRGLVRK